MIRYVILLPIICCATAAALDSALHTGAASAAATQRKGRSIWPFSSPDASAEAAIGQEDALLLEQAGLDKSFNLSSHPLWKIHKYHGIDLKPVQIQTEIVKSKSVNGGGNRSTSVDFDLHSVQTSADETIATTSELPDLSFLDDLGGLADFLPDPEDEEEEASELIAKAIENEESSHPGFLKRLWWRIWGSPESPSATDNSATQKTTASSALEFLSSLFGFAQSQSQQSQQTKSTKGKETEADVAEDSLTIYLPETQGAYMAVVLPSEGIKSPLAPQQKMVLPSQAPPPLFREAVRNVELPEALKAPVNHANEYRDESGIGAGVASLPTGTKALARWPVSGGESQAWIQSWTPHAAYSVRVQGGSSQQQQPQPGQQVQAEQPQSEPSGELEPPTLVEPSNSSTELNSSWPQLLTQDVPPVLEAFQTTRRQQQASRKSSQELPVPDQGPNKGQPEKSPKQSPPSGPTKKRSGDEEEKMADILSHFRIPEGLLRKLQVSQKDVDSILSDKESAARAAERLRSLQKEFEMRKEQLSYVYATRVKKQLN